MPTAKPTPAPTMPPIVPPHISDAIAPEEKPAGAATNAPTIPDVSPPLTNSISSWFSDLNAVPLMIRWTSIVPLIHLFLIGVISETEVGKLVSDR